MAEYIDRTKIFKGCSFIIPENADAALVVQNLLEHINSMPAADVIEPVRCKNCKNGRGKKPYIKKDVWCDVHGKDFYADEFCNKGKRRTDNA